MKVRMVFEFARLVSLLPDEWPRARFVLCGSAPLAARGVRDVRDLDVLVRPDLWPDVLERHARGYWPAAAEPLPDPIDKNAASNDGPRRQLLMTGLIDFFTEPARITSNVGADGVFDAAELRHGYLVQSLRQRARRLAAPTAMAPDARMSLDAEV